MPQMTPKEQKLNDFLVGVFNDILRLEEANLRQSCGNLSVTELHVLDAVARCGPLCGMADIAAALKVTAGTATVAVKTLEQKGYLVRTRHKTDKRPHRGRTGRAGPSRGLSRRPGARRGAGAARG